MMIINTYNFMEMKVFRGDDRCGKMNKDIPVVILIINVIVPIQFV